MEDERRPSLACNAAAAPPTSGVARAQEEPPQHEVFGDGNLNAVFLVLLLLHLLQYAMREPCTC
ncbi:hypothetical protein ACHHYP_13627 [Achlya hypogyna]|uniref:Uncharacterized protein n=1 Tax=Achlya hypogyna TaxID=1202772 RepID=A0A1V9ZG16_ACHHY|nr:hypothetical protein ACHHYP_13627 [Achlya hypogyna]